MRYDAMLFELTVIEDDAKLEHLDISTYVSRWTTSIAHATMSAMKAGRVG